MFDNIFYGLNKRVFMLYVNIAGVDALQDQFMKLNDSPFITISYFSQSLRKPFRWNCQLVSTEFNKQYQRFSELGFQEFIHELIDKKKLSGNNTKLILVFYKSLSIANVGKLETVLALNVIVICGTQCPVLHNVPVEYW